MCGGRELRDDSVRNVAIVGKWRSKEERMAREQWICHGSGGMERWREGNGVVYTVKRDPELGGGRVCLYGQWVYYIQIFITFCACVIL